MHEIQCSRWWLYMHKRSIFPDQPLCYTCVFYFHFSYFPISLETIKKLLKEWFLSVVLFLRNVAHKKPLYYQWIWSVEKLQSAISCCSEILYHVHLKWNPLLHFIQKQWFTCNCLMVNQLLKSGLESQ